MEELSLTGVAAWDAEARKRRQYVDQKCGLTALASDLTSSSETADTRLLLLVSCIQTLQEKLEELQRKIKT